MPVSESQLEECIRSRVEGVRFCRAVDVSDGCGAKFEVIVVSDVFKGKPLLQQHRLVNKAIEEEMKSIHALTLKTKTYEQYTNETSSITLPTLDHDHSTCSHHPSSHDHSSDHHDHSTDHSACSHTDHECGNRDHSHQHHDGHSH